MILRYDGTFAGFLTSVSLARERGLEPEAIADREPEQQGLFAAVESVATSRDRADELYRLIRRTLPPSAMQTFRYAFQSCEPGREILLFRYLQLGLATGAQFGAMLAHEAVIPVWKLARAVGREAHRYKGLVRFRQVEGDVWYAAIEPDHRILPLIAPHFAARFADQRWIIHDPRRGGGGRLRPAPPKVGRDPPGGDRHSPLHRRRGILPGTLAALLSSARHRGTPQSETPAAEPPPQAPAAPAGVRAMNVNSLFLIFQPILVSC